MQRMFLAADVFWYGSIAVRGAALGQVMAYLACAVPISSVPGCRKGQGMKLV
ncbi:hypothetical protein LP417_31040 [Polaromonas sp. P1-6]|nr:hypothetical protein LP417_31040 [Polaromonas sp. P1-6]UUZ68332.1 hypothetical protein LP416_29805 [Polaromonas sp. P2-4]